MFGTRSIQLARIFGIRVVASSSWFVALFVILILLSGQLSDILGSSTVGYEVAVGLSLLYFASLVAHELGHALVARRQDIEVDSIELWLAGGLTRMRGEATSPGGELAIAAAGPLVTLLVAAVCVGAGIAASSARHFLDVAVLAPGVHASPGLLLLGWLAGINALVFVFNLVPVYPLDGGRIASAIAWRITGDRARATRATARLGRGFGLVVSGLGLYLLLLGDLVDGIWLLIIGMFVGQSARAALLQSTLTERVRDVTVADIMDRAPVTIPAATRLLDTQDEYFHRYRWPWFAVVDDVGHFLGLLRAERVEAELRGGRPALTAAEATEDAPPWRIDTSATLEALLRSEGLRRLGAVVAVDADGVLQGVVTLAQVRRALAPTVGVR